MHPPWQLARRSHLPQANGKSSEVSVLPTAYSPAVNVLSTRNRHCGTEQARRPDRTQVHRDGPRNVNSSERSLACDSGQEGAVILIGDCSRYALPASGRMGAAGQAIQAAVPSVQYPFVFLARALSGIRDHPAETEVIPDSPIASICSRGPAPSTMSPCRCSMPGPRLPMAPSVLQGHARCWPCWAWRHGNGIRRHNYMAGSSG